MLEVTPLARAELTLGNMIPVGATPHGSRMIAEVTAARFEGERLNAQMTGSGAADWSLARPDGVVEVDVRMTLETDDGALVCLWYEGNLDPERGAQPVLSRMRFETSDERYLWLNRVVAIGKGEFAAGAVSYDIFELR
ncbi:MAG: DUF3237 domain-containing protein [Gemmatimonadales bacterium]|jgi:hypothetical protein